MVILNNLSAYKAYFIVTNYGITLYLYTYLGYIYQLINSIHGN